MSNSDQHSGAVHTDTDLATLVVHIAEVAQVDAIVCMTESGDLARRVRTCRIGFGLLPLQPTRRPRTPC